MTNKRSGKDESVYNDQMHYVVKQAGLLLSLSAIATGLAVRANLFSDRFYVSDTLFYSLSLGLLLVAWYQYRLKRLNDARRIVLLFAYHIFAAAFMLFVTGFANPIVISWIILALAAHYYFGNRAFWFSMLGLLLAIETHIAVQSLILEQQFIVRSIAYLVIIIGYIISVMRSIDITERQAFIRTRKQEVLQRDRLETLINSMSDAVISTDSHGVVKVYNAAALGILDTNQTLNGHDLSKFINLINEAGKPVKFDTLLKQAKTYVSDDSLRLRYEDGEAINVSLGLAPVHSGYGRKGSQGYIITLRDITKQKSLEEERDEFISVVSHELRTPITIAEGSLSNLQYLFEQNADKKLMATAADTAHEQIMFLAKMINDLSTLSRAERGVADAPELIDIHQLLYATYHEYRPQAEEKKLTLHIDAPPHLGAVYVSRLYIEEVLQNFITNALKYTKEGSITIGAKKSGEMVEFFVRDTGIGISKSDQKHIFEKFFRSEDYRTRETAGTGLGLYVVRKLSQKMNTRVEFVSRLNHGSTFSFKLPLKQTEATKKASETPTDAPNAA